MATRDAPAAPVRERLPWFHSLVLIVLPTVLASFGIPIYAAYIHGDQFKVQGWRAQFAGDGWVVDEVDANGPAAVLEAGDRVVAVDGDDRAGTIGPEWYLRDAPPTEPYRVLVSRAGVESSYELRFAVERVPGTIPTRIIPILVMAFVFYVISVVIWVAKPNDPLARFGFAVTMLGTYAFLFIGTNEAAGMLQGRLHDFALVLASVSPLHFMFGHLFYIHFPHRVELGPRGRLLSRGIVWGGAVFWVAMTSHNIVRIVGGEWARGFVAGAPGVFRSYAAVVPSAQMLYAALALLITLVMVQRNYARMPDGDGRRRLRWIATGALFGLTPMALTAVMLFVVRAAGLDETRGPIALARTAGNLAGIVLPITIGYAILKQRVFGPRVAIRLGFQYLMARRVLRVLLALPILGLIVSVAMNPNRTIAELLGGAAGLNLILVALAGISIRFRRQIMEVIDKRFFREAYDQDQILLDLIDAVKERDSIHEISALLRAEIENALHSQGIYIYYRRERERDLFLVHSSSSSDGRVEVGGGTTTMDQAELRLRGNSELTSLLSRSGGSVMWDEIRESTGGDFARGMDALGVQVIVPIPGTDGSVLGVIMLGEKRSEEPYTGRDRRLLDSIATQVGMAYENLALRERVKIEEQAQTHVLARLEDQDVDVMWECPSCGVCYDPPTKVCASDGQTLEVRIPTGRLVDGKYRLDRRVGEGGMGAVYQATDTRLERKVAVKILTGRLFGDASALRRFAREARASALLSHPNIVRTYDFGEIRGEGAFLVQEFLGGDPLSAWYPRLREDPRAAATVMDSILAGIEEAHAAQVIHRDLKPDNVIVRAKDESGEFHVKVLDFGLAKVRQLEFADPKSRTELGLAMGTLGYMSLEQSLGQETDHRADIYSLGVIALEMITGPLPKTTHFAYAHIRDTLQDRLGGESATAEEGALREALESSLALHAQDRCASVEQMRSTLIPAMAGIRPRS